MAAETNQALDGFVEVVDSNTGLVQRVPADWLDNPRTGRFFQKTLPQLALERALPRPASDTKVRELRDLATEAGVDLGDATTKADILTVLEPYFATAEDEPEGPTDDGGNAGDPSNPTTPAAGDNPNS